MSDYHINIFYSEEDGGYIADIPDLEAFRLSAPPLKRPWPKWTGPKPLGWLPPSWDAGGPSPRHGIDP